MENVTIILMVALLVESVWDTLKMTWQEGKISIDRIGALIVALIVCLSVNINILDLLGIKAVSPLVGVVLTGVLVSRGSNFIHDLFGKITKKGV